MLLILLSLVKRFFATLLKTPVVRARACHAGRKKKGTSMGDNQMELILSGHGLTTAEITYRMPDYQNVLQTYVWQEYDLSPRFPNLHKFLEFWRDSLDGPLHSVRYVHQKLIRPGEWRNVSGEFRLH